MRARGAKDGGKLAALNLGCGHLGSLSVAAVIATVSAGDGGIGRATSLSGPLERLRTVVLHRRRRFFRREP